MWKSVCCEVQGTGHLKKRIPCQDKTFELTEGGVHVVALADGAGSAKMSHYGAERVVRAASEYFAKHFRECLECDSAYAVKQNLLETIHNNLTQEAGKRKCGIRDLSSTLLLVAVDEENFILAHVGDGVIGYLDGDRLKVAFKPDNGEFSNETTFVTSKQALSRIRLSKGKLENKNGFVLMSDGTGQSLYHKRSGTLSGGIVEIMRRTCLLRAQVIKSKLEDAFTRLISKQTTDDCSIAILARPSGALPPLSKLSFEERLELYGLSDQKARARREWRKRSEVGGAAVFFSGMPVVGIVCLKRKSADRHFRLFFLPAGNFVRRRAKATSRATRGVQLRKGDLKVEERTWN